MLSIGARIRQLRLCHRPPLTLVELAGETVSAGLVSKIERDRVSPSLDTLAYLARRLQVPIAALFEDDGVRAARAAAGARHTALALLWLGDPAAAAGAATAAAEAAAAWPLGRMSLLGIAAEALLAAGNATRAAERVVEATALLPRLAGAPAAAASAEQRAAQAQLAWVLGSLERRRGDLAGAERSWSACLEWLDALDTLAPAAGSMPDVRLLHAQALVQLASLHDVSGARETARNFFTRAADALRRLADPAGAARTALAAGAAAGDGGLAGGPAAGDSSAGDPAAAVAAALAAIAAAARLLERTERELWRLERAAVPAYASAPAPQVPHSRHLR